MNETEEVYKLILNMCKNLERIATSTERTENAIVAACAKLNYISGKLQSIDTQKSKETLCMLHELLQKINVSPARRRRR